MIINKKRFLGLLVLFFFVSTTMMAQKNVSTIKKKEHLKMLNEGVLLIRLPNIDKKLAALKKANLHKRAKTEQAENEELHAIIKEMFIKHYNFSRFCFFDSSDTKKVKNLNFEGIVLDSEDQLVEIKEGVDIYIGDIGIANPAGETHRYNGEGIHIKHLKDGGIHEISKDVFFKGPGTGGAFLRSPRRVYKWAVKKLNHYLHLGFKPKYPN